MNIAEIRQKYPQYSDMSDLQLAQSMHKKFYSDMDFAEFGKRVGVGMSAKLAADDAATIKANEEANILEQFGTGAKTQAGRVVLGLTEFADNLTGNKWLDANQRELLAEAQKEADRRDAGTGVAGFAGNIAGDFRNWIPVAAGGKAVTGAQTLKQAAMQGGKIGAVAGGVTGLTEGTGNKDSTIASNLGNAAVGAGLGVGVGMTIPVGVAAVKGATKAVGGGIERTLAGMGSEKMATKVAYKNIAKALKGQGYNPGEVTAIIDEFKAQGIDGGTLGKILESSDLLAREKNLLQGGGEASRIMGEALKDQPKQIAKSVVAKVSQYLQPDQTSYLYKQAGELADAASMRGLPVDGTLGMGQSASGKELPFTLKAIREDLAERAGELPPAIVKRITKILDDAKGDDFLSVDKAKQKLADLYKANSSTTEQDIINEVAEGYRKMLNESLEQAGGDVYKMAKSASKRDMAMRDVVEAFEGSQGSSVKTALSKFFGSIEKQDEFLAKLPDDQARNEFLTYIANLGKVSGSFGGSDTFSNTATNKAMNIESGLGFDANVVSPQAWVDRFGAPISRNVRKAQAKATFAPDTERLGKAMKSLDFKDSTPKELLKVLSNELTKGTANIFSPEGSNETITPTNSAPPGGAAGAVAPQSNLFQRVIQQESGGKQLDGQGRPITSPKGATGIAQIMPKTGPEAAKLAGLPWDAKRFRTDAAYNAALGEAYLNKQLQTFGNELHALMAYNWGPGNVKLWLKSGARPERVPKETRGYVQAILGG